MKPPIQNMLNKGRPSAARFCPYCGVADTLSRDESSRKTNSCDFICSICCAGFRLSQSPRLQKALELFAERRAMRDGKLQDFVTDDIRRQWAQASGGQGLVWPQPPAST